MIVVIIIFFKSATKLRCNEYATNNFTFLHQIAIRIWVELLLALFVEKYL
jgi:hypothetical protein